MTANISSKDRTIVDHKLNFGNPNKDKSYNSSQALWRNRPRWKINVKTELLLKTQKINIKFVRFFNIIEWANCDILTEFF